MAIYEDLHTVTRSIRKYMQTMLFVYCLNQTYTESYMKSQVLCCVVIFVFYDTISLDYEELFWETGSHAD